MSSNFIKTTFLFTVIIAIFMVTGSLVGGYKGAITALIFAFGINFFTYWFSDTIILKMYKAKKNNSHQFPELNQIVKELTLSANIPMPKVFIMNQNSPNAFATGRNPNNAVIAVTKGLIEIMNKEELKGVIAHELAHIKNRDILVGSLVATITGAIMVIASIARWSIIFKSTQGKDNSKIGILGLIIMSILAPIAATIVQMSISRDREYLADLTGSTIANNPNGLVNALKKLELYSHGPEMKANPSTAHMFIVSPLSGEKFHNLFSTHPSISSRVNKLLEKGKNGKYINKIKNYNRSGKGFWEHIDN